MSYDNKQNQGGQNRPGQQGQNPNQKPYDKNRQGGTTGGTGSTGGSTTGGQGGTGRPGSNQGGNNR